MSQKVINTESVRAVLLQQGRRKLRLAAAAAAHPVGRDQTLLKSNYDDDRLPLLLPQPDELLAALLLLFL